MSKGVGQSNHTVVIVNHMHESIEPLLQAAGFATVYVPTIAAADIPALLTEAVGLIIRSKVYVDENILKDAPHLRFVGRAGAGTDNIDLEYLKKRGIHLLNAPEGNRDALAEHTLGMILMLFNRLQWADAEVRAGTWARERNRGIELKHRTVGIYGYGFMGQAFAKRLAGFGCRVLAYDKYKTNIADPAVEQVSLDRFYEEVDVVSLHVPLTAETQYLADASFWNRFHKPLYVVNTARGGVLSLTDLVAAMQAGKVLGCALDVLENENLATLSPEQQGAMEYLTQAENTIFSPHVAGWSQESFAKINYTLVDKIKGLNLQA